MSKKSDLPPLSEAERAACDLMNTRLEAAMEDDATWHRLLALSDARPPGLHADQKPISEVVSEINALMDKAGVPRVAVN